jgi:hypothetical protein
VLTADCVAAAMRVEVRLRPRRGGRVRSLAIGALGALFVVLTSREKA